MSHAQTLNSNFSAVYGPVKSWRFGQSLGIDPIGMVTTCSFNCVYCQLGQIQQQTLQRRVFVPTQQIIEELQLAMAQAAADVVTISGSGEPTLALNLGDILAQVRQMSHYPLVVLTNGTLLGDRAVRQALQIADYVAVKLDGLSSDHLQRINHPTTGVDWEPLITNIEQFRCDYQGHLALQTMVLSPWSEETETTYLQLLQRLQPDEVQLNRPTRPRPLVHQLSDRGNHQPNPESGQQYLRCVSGEVLQSLADRITSATQIPVRYSPVRANGRSS